MKTLFASCAVIALMAAPAVAQSTFESTDPLVQTPEELDPTTRDPTYVPEEFPAETPDSADTAANAAPSDQTMADESTTNADESMTADTDTATETDTDLDAQAEGNGMQDSGIEVADAEPTFGVEAVEGPLDVADLPDDYSSEDLNAMMLAQLNVVADEIADANAAAGSNVYASAVTSPSASSDMGSNTWSSADQSAASGMETGASDIAEEGSTENYAASDMGSDTATQTGDSAADYAANETSDAWAPAQDNSTADNSASGVNSGTSNSAEDGATQDYAGSRMGADNSSPSESATTGDYAASEMGSGMAAANQEQTANNYAATDTGSEGLMSSPSTDDSMVPSAPSLGTGTAQTAGAVEMGAEETDDSVQMAGQSDGAFVTAEGDIDQSAADIAAGDARFSTLVELVGTAGLEDALSQDGSYTVFAPTNDAFAALPEKTLTRLKSEEGKAELTEILKSHVAEGAVLSGDVPLSGQSVETLGDTSLQVTGSTDGTLNVQGSNTIGEGISATNGVVYAIDAVILPDATAVGTDTGTDG